VFSVPDISSVVLRTEAASAAITWAFSLDPKLSEIVLANTTLLHYTPVPSTSPCPSSHDIVGSLPPPPRVEVHTQAGGSTLTGLAASDEYCVTVQAITVTGNASFSHVQRLSCKNKELFMLLKAIKQLLTFFVSFLCIYIYIYSAFQCQHSVSTETARTRNMPDIPSKKYNTPTGLSHHLLMFIFLMAKVTSTLNYW